MLSKEEDAINEFIIRNFGERYKEAHLSRIEDTLGYSERVGKWIAEPKNFLILLGPPGTSKTYLESAIIRHIFSSYYRFDKYGFFVPSGRDIRIFKEHEIFTMLRQSFDDFNNADYKTVLKQKIADHLLIIDDFCASSSTPFREDVIFDLVDFRYSSRLPTIFSSNCSKSEIKDKYHARISDRLFASENTIVEIDFKTGSLREEGL